MANMTIENIGQFIQRGDIEQITGGGQKIQNPVAPELPNMEVPGNKTESSTFTQALEKSLDDLNKIQLQADRAAKELVAGRNKNVHETMLLMEKADVSFRLAMQVRNKVIEAYREIMRMQV